MNDTVVNVMHMIPERCAEHSKTVKLSFSFQIKEQAQHQTNKKQNKTKQDKKNRKEKKTKPTKLANKQHEQL